MGGVGFDPSLAILRVFDFVWGGRLWQFRLSPGLTLVRRRVFLSGAVSPNNVNMCILGASRPIALVGLLADEREEQKSTFAGKRRFSQMSETTFIRRPRLYLFCENLLV